MHVIQGVLEGISITVFSLVNFGLQPVEQVKGEVVIIWGTLFGGERGWFISVCTPTTKHF